MELKKILDIFVGELERNTFLTSTKLSERVLLSPKTVSNRINDLNQMMTPSVAEIVGVPGKGYQLKVGDNDRFEKFYQSLLATEEVARIGNPRLNQIVSIIMASNGIITTERLEECLYISRSQLFSDIKVLRTQLSEYGIELTNNRSEGLHIVGEETEIRAYLSDYQVTENDDKQIVTEADRFMIQRATIQFFKKSNLDISDFALENLVNHLVVMVYRMRTGNSIADNNEDVDTSSEIYAYASDLFEKIANSVNLQHSQEEVVYLMMHLSGKLFIPNLDKDLINLKARNVVSNMLEEIYLQRNIDFRKSENLQLLLMHHTIPLIHRIQHNLVLKNELLDDIKTKFIAAYDLASIATSVINRIFKTILSEDEIAYYALHFEVALSKQLATSDKYKILVICSSGKGTSQLLKYQFISEFGDFIESIETSTLNAMDQMDLPSFDYIFSTIPLTSHKAHVIPHFLDDYSIGEITSVLKDEGQSAHDILQYFPEDLFISSLKENNCEAIIDAMVKRIGQVREIPDEFKEEIFAREQISSTDMIDGIAFPHPNKPLTKETFVAIACLDKPVLWDKRKVRVVFMAAIEIGEMKDLQNFYKVMSRLMVNKNVLNRLSANPTYENFRELILHID